MNRFIKLTYSIINVNKIARIGIYPNSYGIYLTNNLISGYYLFTFGSISTTENLIMIYKEQEPKDYDIITKWIEQLDNAGLNDVENDK